ncbi:MAG TPA: hypothetical protein VGO79_07030, partial [Thermoanaerobaculia bacterium]
MESLRESKESELRTTAGGEMAELVRAMHALRDLAQDARKAQSAEECLKLAARSLDRSDLGLTFLLFYVPDDRG